jgi:hypothetical protein
MVVPVCRSGREIRQKSSSSFGADARTTWPRASVHDRAELYECVDHRLDVSDAAHCRDSGQFGEEVFSGADTIHQIEHRATLARQPGQDHRAWVVDAQLQCLGGAPCPAEAGTEHRAHDGKPFGDGSAPGSGTVCTVSRPHAWVSEIHREP